MMTLKVWNTLAPDTRKEIINLCGFNATDGLLQAYHHNFDYDATGKRLRSVLECCYLRPSDKKIIVSIEVKPKYAAEPKKAPVKKTAKVAIKKLTAQEAIAKIDAGYSTALATLPDILKTFGDKNRMFNVKGEFECNHRIESFCMNKKGQIWVDIYWQGDSTDGCDSFCLTEHPNGTVIPEDSFFDGYRTRIRHSDIRITKDEIYNAIKLIKEKIAPKEEKREPTCCVCGKPLSREDIHYYDLTSYCIDCAIADGIRTSK